MYIDYAKNQDYDDIELTTKCPFCTNKYPVFLERLNHSKRNFIDTWYECISMNIYETFRNNKFNNDNVKDTYLPIR